MRILPVTMAFVLGLASCGGGRGGNVGTLTTSPSHEVQIIDGGPCQPDIYAISLPGNRSVRAYVDPGAPGENEVHLTFFDPAGGELSVRRAAINAKPAGGNSKNLEVRQHGPGHFVAGVDLERGSWRFGVEASTENGDVLTAQFDQEITE